MRRDTDSNGKPIMLYSGDADLTKDQNGVEILLLDKLKKLIANTVSITGYLPEVGAELIK